jgi:UDP-glucuronate 4-epimerase
LIFASSSSVYGNSTPAPFSESAPAISPISPYAASKRAGELLLASAAPLYGMQVAMLRFFTVFGPRQRPDLAIHKFAGKMIRGEKLALYGDGSQARDYTYCDDIVAGVTAAIDWTGAAPVGAEAFNLGGSHPVTLAVLVATLAKALGVDANVEWQSMQAGDVELTSADLTKSARVLGYAPLVSFPEGIRRFVTWFREEQAVTATGTTLRAEAAPTLPGV